VRHAPRQGARSGEPLREQEKARLRQVEADRIKAQREAELQRKRALCEDPKVRNGMPCMCAAARGEVHKGPVCEA